MDRIWHLIVDGQPVEMVAGETEDDLLRNTNIEWDVAWDSGIVLGTPEAKEYTKGHKGYTLTWKWDGTKVIRRPEGELDPRRAFIIQEAAQARRYRRPTGQPLPPGMCSRRLQGPTGQDATVEESEALLCDRMHIDLAYRIERDDVQEEQLSPRLMLPSERVVAIARLDLYVEDAIVARRALPAGHPWQDETLAVLPVDPFRTGSADVRWPGDPPERRVPGVISRLAHHTLHPEYSAITLATRGHARVKDRAPVAVAAVNSRRP